MTRTPPPDPYAVLGVDRDAPQAEITAAYRRLVRALHPDAHRPDPDRLAAVLAAYRLLRDPEQRAAHDRTQPGRDSGTPIVVHKRPPRPGPDLRAGPVRHHPYR
ncbi:J domain-containing protein [Amycolatopsis anabasis]|uniref:J domain-containing protein n=1 Tax=Amycolatopsis anabasis TaxID=1840409 RepID=UPI00131CE6C0|nr:J domain-containing protein [Amycolatopsis anabasis]